MGQGVGPDHRLTGLGRGLFTVSSGTEGTEEDVRLVKSCWFVFTKAKANDALSQTPTTCAPSLLRG